ncbi:unnamed protein product [Durusdinium trenchii]|uniref:EF-hand domain-containing protein n=1 Tax=Durusdinium trenchii TaxID=1381693 RepID=A0ABP0QH14_9DINO
MAQASTAVAPDDVLVEENKKEDEAPPATPEEAQAEENGEEQVVSIPRKTFFVDEEELEETERKTLLQRINDWASSGVVYLPKSVDIANKRVNIVYCFLEIVVLALTIWYFVQRPEQYSVSLTPDAQVTFCGSRCEPLPSRMDAMTDQDSSSYCGSLTYTNGADSYGPFECLRRCGHPNSTTHCLQPSELLRISGEEAFVPTSYRLTDTLQAVNGSCAMGYTLQSSVCVWQQDYFVPAIEKLAVSFNHQFVVYPVYNSLSFMERAPPLKAHSGAYKSQGWDVGLLSVLFSPSGAEVKRFQPGQGVTLTLEEILQAAYVEGADSIGLDSVYSRADAAVSSLPARLTGLAVRTVRATRDAPDGTGQSCPAQISPAMGTGRRVLRLARVLLLALPGALAAQCLEEELQLLQTHAEAAASKESLWAQEVFADASFYQVMSSCDGGSQSRISQDCWNSKFARFDHNGDGVIDAEDLHHEETNRLGGGAPPHRSHAPMANFTRQEVRAGLALAAQWFPEQASRLITHATLITELLLQEDQLGIDLSKVPEPPDPLPKLKGYFAKDVKGRALSALGTSEHATTTATAKSTTSAAPTAAPNTTAPSSACEMAVFKVGTSSANLILGILGVSTPSHQLMEDLLEKHTVVIQRIISVVQEKEVQDNAGVALKVWQIFDILHEEQIFRKILEEDLKDMSWWQAALVIARVGATVASWYASGTALLLLQIGLAVPSAVDLVEGLKDVHGECHVF